MVRQEAQALSLHDQTEYLKVEQDAEDETWDLYIYMGLWLVRLGGSWSSAVLGLVFCNTDVLQPTLNINVHRGTQDPPHCFTDLMHLSSPQLGPRTVNWGSDGQTVGQCSGTFSSGPPRPNIDMETY